MSKPIERWEREHGNFVRLLDLIDNWTVRFRAGEEVEYELLREVMYYMTHYPDRYHHPLEDAVFDYLAQRHEEYRAAVEELSVQHRQIAELGKALVDDLDAIVGDAVMSREAVVEDAASYSELMRHHMKLEESTLFPAIAEHCTDADWEAAVSRVGDGIDPMFGDSVEQRYETVHREIARQIGCDCDTGTSQP
ncbi:MAG: hemerythrin domain-containing protein [Azoarcus sp.]|nr:hemerythrin domain-containing protein [Azoarcus sp.]